LGFYQRVLQKKKSNAGKDIEQDRQQQPAGEAILLIASS
jgi:hypothetical protein